MMKTSESRACHWSLALILVKIVKYPKGVSLTKIRLRHIFHRGFKIYLFNWRIITLQYYDGLCHTSTWISHRYTCDPSPSPPCPSRLSQSTCFGFRESQIKLPLAIYFTYCNVYVSILFSPIIPPSPSPTVCKSLFTSHWVFFFLLLKKRKGVFQAAEDISGPQN